MTIILLILKIIGIILLIILGLILLIVSAVLFVPVKYRITGNIEDSVTIKIRFHWMLHFMSFFAIYENKEFQKDFKIFGISRKKIRNWIKQRRKKKKKQAKKNVVKTKVVSKEKPDTKEQQKKEEVKEKPDIKEQPKKEEVKEKPDIKEQPKKEEVKEKPDIKEQPKKEEIKEKLRKITAIPGMIRSKWESIKTIKAEIINEDKKNAIRIILRELKYLLNYAAPKKVKGRISFGTENPATTGEILGIISMLPLVYRYKIQIQPDFEAECGYVKGNFDVKGAVRGIYLFGLKNRLSKDAYIRKLMERYDDL